VFVGIRAPICILLGLQLCLCVMLRTLPAIAQGTHGRTSSLSWVRLEGAESCIARMPSRRRSKASQRKVFVSASQADVSVEGHVQRTKQGNPSEWRAVFTLRDAHGTLIGTREIDGVGSSCSSLDDSMVFVVSVLIRSRRCARKTTPAPEPPPPATTPSSASHRASGARLGSGRAAESMAFRGQCWSSRVGGLLPGVGVRCDGAVLPSRPAFWGIQLSGTSWLVRQFLRTAAREVTCSSRYGGLRRALSPGNRAVSYRACAGVEVGSLQSRGVGFDKGNCGRERRCACIFLPSRLRFSAGGPFGCQPSVSR